MMKIDQIVPGMVTAAPVVSKKGQLIVEKDVKLTEHLISRMFFYGVAEASIADTGDSKPLPARPKPELSYSQKVRQSTSFQQFQLDYTNHGTNFADYLTRFKDTKNPRYAKELAKISKALLAQTRTSIEFFDMIHNLRGFDDSICAHSLNVAMISRMLGKWLKLSDEELDTLTMAAALHDIGKFEIPEEILNKEERLTDEEFDLIRKHPSFGYDLLKSADLNRSVKNAALMHHERCDGSGYPNGLKADEIDKYALVIAIADVYDAMTAARKYRAPLCPFQVIAEFEKDGLSKYHPKYILTFLKRIANTYQNNRVILSDGRSAKIIFLNQNHLSKPMVQLNDGNCLDLDREPDLYIKSVV